MTSVQFKKLSSLVLVDILAALPMKIVVRMARLGHERLRQACSLKWVKDRMTHVTFETLVRAQRTGGDVAATFCSKSVMKRFNGRVAIHDTDFRNTGYVNACREIVKGFTGSIQFYSEGAACIRPGDGKGLRNFEKLSRSLCIPMKLTYVSKTIKRRMNYQLTLIKFSAEVVFDYSYCPRDMCHDVYYRPALLHGRHVIDVLRAVCGPADVSEAELTRIKEEAIKKEEDLSLKRDKEWKGVWCTSWFGFLPVVTALF